MLMSRSVFITMHITIFIKHDCLKNAFSFKRVKQTCFMHILDSSFKTWLFYSLEEPICWFPTFFGSPVCACASTVCVLQDTPLFCTSGLQSRALFFRTFIPGWGRGWDFVVSVAKLIWNRHFLPFIWAFWMSLNMTQNMVLLCHLTS